MKDNQIINENWFEAMTRQVSESFDKLTIRKPVVIHIPITVWSEVSGDFHLPPLLENWKYIGLRNQGGKTYLVTEVNNER